MATITERNGRWRALVRRSGHTRCETFSTRAAAKEWAGRVEGEIEELRKSGVMQPRGTTLGKLIERYIEELYPMKRWGRSKSADLAALKRSLGELPLSKITAAHLTTHFRKRAADGAGPVTISSQAGYLVGVLKVARTLWHLDVPLQEAQDARSALANVGIIGKAQRRDRRVSDAEIATLIAHFDKHKGQLPHAELIRFSVATGMRISETCRLRWADLNEADRTIIVRDRKHPRDKLGNDQVVPLLNATGFDAFEIVKRQPKEGPRVFPYSEKTVSTLFTRAAKSLKLGDLHLHDLRHEAISRLFEAGYRIEQVALVSGHRDWAMLKRYTHVRAKDLHRKAAA